MCTRFTAPFLRCTGRPRPPAAARRFHPGTHFAGHQGRVPAASFEAAAFSRSRRVRDRHAVPPPSPSSRRPARAGCGRVRQLGPRRGRRPAPAARRGVHDGRRPLPGDAGRQGRRRQLRALHLRGLARGAGVARPPGAPRGARRGHRGRPAGRAGTRGRRLAVDLHDAHRHERRTLHARGGALGRRRRVPHVRHRDRPALGSDLRRLPPLHAARASGRTIRLVGAVPPRRRRAPARAQRRLPRRRGREGDHVHRPRDGRAPRRRRRTVYRRRRRKDLRLGARGGRRRARRHVERLDRSS